MSSPPSTTRIGAHVSIAGGIDNAVSRQRDVGGNCGQVFTHSPQVWKQPPIEAERAERFREKSSRELDGPFGLDRRLFPDLWGVGKDLPAVAADVALA